MLHYLILSELSSHRLLVGICLQMSEAGHDVECNGTHLNPGVTSGVSMAITVIIGCVFLEFVK